MGAPCQGKRGIFFESFPAAGRGEGAGRALSWGNPGNERFPGFLKNNEMRTDDG